MMTDSSVAIVTGASSGIGRATAVLLAEADYRVALVGRRREKLRETADLCAQRSSRSADECTLLVPWDLTVQDAPTDIAQRVLEKLGRIDALANIAGDAPVQPIEQITYDVWRKCVDVNVSTVVLLTAAVWPAFTQQGQGVIVNVSSLASIDPFPQFSIYAAAKAAVNMFTHCTAKEGESHGIRAVAVAPGAVETPMLRSIFSKDDLPPDRTLDPADVAAVIRDCITGQRDFANGETIQVLSP